MSNNDTSVHSMSKNVSIVLLDNLKRGWASNYCHYPSGMVLMCTISSLDVLSSYLSDKSVQSQVQSLILETPSLFLG